MCRIKRPIRSPHPFQQASTPPHFKWYNPEISSAKDMSGPNRLSVYKGSLSLVNTCIVVRHKLRVLVFQRLSPTQRGLDLYSREQSRDEYKRGCRSRQSRRDMLMQRLVRLFAFLVSWTFPSDFLETWSKFTVFGFWLVVQQWRLVAAWKSSPHVPAFPPLASFDLDCVPVRFW
jgi:hypothetical protein